MAAWVAVVKAVDANGESGVLISVSYFAATDTQHTNELYQRTFSAEPGSPLASLIPDVRAAGARAREALDTAAQAQTRVGQTINVP
jgi:hypothetical protein